MRIKTQTLYGKPFLMEINGVVLRNDAITHQTIKGKQKGVTGFGCEETIEIGSRENIIRIIAEKISENPMVQAVKDVVKAHRELKKKKSKPTDNNGEVTPPTDPATEPPKTEAFTERRSISKLIELAIENEDVSIWDDILENTTWNIQALPPETNETMIMGTQPENPNVFVIKETSAA